MQAYIVRVYRRRPLAGTVEPAGGSARPFASMAELMRLLQARPTPVPPKDGPQSPA